ncbi:MAG: hypothetical protein [Caudoviricetes sp.]|nr:MAG: hypothetical protein [Caudoviricetes sp.]
MRTKINGSAKVLDLTLNRVPEQHIRWNPFGMSTPDQRFKGNLVVEIDVTSMEVGPNGLKDFMQDCEREINNLVGNPVVRRGPQAHPYSQIAAMEQHYEGQVKHLRAELDVSTTAYDKLAKEVARLKRQHANQAATIDAQQKDVATAQATAKAAQAVVDALADAHRGVVKNSTHYKEHMARSPLPRHIRFRP